MVRPAWSQFNGQGGVASSMACVKLLMMAPVRRHHLIGSGVHRRNREVPCASVVTRWSKSGPTRETWTPSMPASVTESVTCPEKANGTKGLQLHPGGSAGRSPVTRRPVGPHSREP